VLLGDSRQPRPPAARRTRLRPGDSRGAELLFQVITEREERASIAIGTNLPFSECGTVFPDPRLAAAIVDRVTFNAHILETGTQSYRLHASKAATRSTKPAKPPATPGRRQNSRRSVGPNHLTTLSVFHPGCDGFVTV